MPLFSQDFLLLFSADLATDLLLPKSNLTTFLILEFHTSNEIFFLMTLHTLFDFFPILQIGRNTITL